MPSSTSPRFILPFERLAGWERRLIDLCAAARLRPFAWGQHDCFLFACADVEALTGADLAAAWRGTYSTQREALVAIAAYGDTWTGAFTRLFGTEPVPMRLARRGDIADFVNPGGEHHLGVVTGSNVAVLGERAMASILRSRCAHAWRIG